MFRANARKRVFKRKVVLWDGQSQTLTLLGGEWYQFERTKLKPME